ncbi:hypothetical protein MASR2M47_15390 [Draconibacterium sp.]
MKQLITLVLCSAMALNTWAQTDTTEVKFDKKNVEVITDEWGDTTYIRVDSKLYKVIEGDNGKYVKVATDEWGDTTQINVGNQSYKVIDDNNGKNVNEVKVGKKNVVTVIEDGDNVHVVVGDKEKGKGVEVLTDEWGDTTHIRVGRRSFKVIEGNNGTYVKYEKEDKSKKWHGSLNPHWSGLEVAMNMVYKTDYSIYNGTEYAQYGDFFDLNPGKSLSWNLNLPEFAFKNEKKTFALVTGLGFSFNDYAFSDAYTIEKQNGSGMIVPVPIDEQNNGLKKSKLHINYLTAPLFFEVKTPLRMGGSHLTLAAGVIGGLYLGSHTKYKFYDGDKEKKKSNYHINQWKYDITARIGFGDFCVFMNYGMTSIFKEGKGPQIYPMQFGISFPNI